MNRLVSFNRLETHHNSRLPPLDGVHRWCIRCGMVKLLTGGDRIDGGRNGPHAGREKLSGSPNWHRYKGDLTGDVECSIM